MPTMEIPSTIMDLEMTTLSVEKEMMSIPEIPSVAMEEILSQTIMKLKEI
jgi:hypothetical protein